MKKNNKGFMLVEILIVSVFISSVLIVLFVQFRKINNSYNTSFKYNTVEGMYLLNSVKNRIITNSNDNNFNNFEAMLNDNNKYIDIYNYMCEDDGYDCQLISKANIIKLFFARKDAKNDILDDNLTVNFKDFIYQINFNNNVSDYFIIAEFSNGTFASINI